MTKRERCPAWLVVGTVVDYHSIIGGPVTQPGMVVRHGPQMMCGSWVVWLTGKAGCVAVDACTLAKGATMTLDRPDGYCARCDLTPCGCGLPFAANYCEGTLARRLSNLATCLREAAIGCAGFEAGVDHASGVQHAWWYPGCNIPRPSTPNAEGEK